MRKIRWNVYCYNLCFALNCLLLFLAIFGARMELPAFLQVAGRMHPLALHFPIVLMVLSGIWETALMAKDQPSLQGIGDVVLLSSALSASVTGLMGLFLSKEGGYDPETLRWHQWGGISISGIAWAWYAFRVYFRKSSFLAPLMAVLGLLLLLFAGHQGATLTHGDNYLFAPVAIEAEAPPVQFENALAYQHLVRPILKEKCMGCHNSNKIKGELNMETEAMLIKGGKNGALWDSTAEGYGLMLQRIHLPLEEKEHMPPKGKAQLTREEVDILSHWIKNGADFTLNLAELPENDTLRMLGAARLSKSPASPPYPFRAADDALVRKLNNEYRVVTPLALNTPALGVDFYGISMFNSAWLKDLETVKEQVVRLNLSKMPLKDDDLKKLPIFPNLHNLNLAFTQITGAALGELRNMKSLKSLSLSGTSVKARDLAALRNLPELRELYLWHTEAGEAELAQLQQELPGIRFELGFRSDGIVAKLNAPVIAWNEQVFSQSTKVKLKNFIRGAELRYTLDGSMPDSLHSILYSGDSIRIEKTCQLSAKAFLHGWASSEVATQNFYKTGVLPDSVVLAHPPNTQYKGEGAKTLANQKIGDTDFRSNKWLGFKETNLEALLLFGKPVTISSVSISALVDIGSYIMPAAEIQVWGGNDNRNLLLLKKLRPAQPNKLGAAGYRTGYHCSFKPTKIKVLKIVAKPVAKLPPWHPGKGERGWVFVDEVFLE